MTTEVILVDADDNAIGTMEKMEAHQKGLLHRALSVLIFNSKGEMLLQKRARTKYHSGGLWTNSCCSHPYPNETAAAAAARRLKEELGIDVQPTFEYKFIYKAALDRNIIEYEVDHVFTATYDGPVTVNADEVEDWKFIDITTLLIDIEQNPHQYTQWFKLIVRDRYLTTVIQ